MSDGARFVFGYGSLLWRPDFHYLERVVGCVRGLARRFWQGSPDHRGRPDTPGRVVTLVEDPEALCWGAVYRVDTAQWREIGARLDARESGGFERVLLDVSFAGGLGSARALSYVARPGNPNFLGPAPLETMAAQVRRAHGRSGTNVEYVLKLAAAVRALGSRDEHVFLLADRVAAGAAPPGGATEAPLEPPPAARAPGTAPPTGAQSITALRPSAAGSPPRPRRAGGGSRGSGARRGPRGR